MQEVHQSDGLTPYRNLSYEKYKAKLHYENIQYLSVNNVKK